MNKEQIEKAKKLQIKARYLLGSIENCYVTIDLYEGNDHFKEKVFQAKERIKALTRSYKSILMEIVGIEA